jgi:hypothetical protein
VAEDPTVVLVHPQGGPDLPRVELGEDLELQGFEEDNTGHELPPVVIGWRRTCEDQSNSGGRNLVDSEGVTDGVIQRVKERILP